MLGKNHAAVGIGTGILIKDTALMNTGLYNLNSHLPLISTAASLKMDAFLALILGCLVVDLDCDNSIICRKLIPIKNDSIRTLALWILGIVLLIFPMAILKYIGLLIILGRISQKVTKKYYFDFSSFSIKSTTFIKHRWIFHSLLGLIINLIPIYWLQEKTGLFIVIPFTIGYLLHLAMDALDEWGIPLFYPITRKRFKIPIVRNYLAECLVVYTYFLYSISTIIVF